MLVAQVMRHNWHVVVAESLAGLHLGRGGLKRGDDSKVTGTTTSVWDNVQGVSVGDGKKKIEFMDSCAGIHPTGPWGGVAVTITYSRTLW